VDKDSGFLKPVNQWTCFHEKLSLIYAFGIITSILPQRANGDAKVI